MEPGDPVFGPDVVLGGAGGRFVQGGDGDIDLMGPGGFGEGDLGAAGRAEAADRAGRRSVLGRPAVKRNASAGTIAQVTTVPPLARRHMVQWQWTTRFGGPAIW